MAKFPEESVAVQVTVVPPREYAAGASLVIIGVGSESSVAVATPMSTSVRVPIASVLISAGAVTTGGATSVTVTVNEV